MVFKYLVTWLGPQICCCHDRIDSIFFITHIGPINCIKLECFTTFYHVYIVYDTAVIRPFYGSQTKQVLLCLFVGVNGE